MADAGEVVAGAPDPVGPGVDVAAGTPGDELGVAELFGTPPCGAGPREGCVEPIDPVPIDPVPAEAVPVDAAPAVPVPVDPAPGDGVPGSGPVGAVSSDPGAPGDDAEDERVPPLGSVRLPPPLRCGAAVPPEVGIPCALARAEVEAVTEPDPDCPEAGFPPFVVLPGDPATVVPSVPAGCPGGRPPTA